MARPRIKSIDQKIVDRIQEVKNCNRKEAWKQYALRLAGKLKPIEA